MLKYGGGVLPNTPTEEFENVLFWTFNQSGQVEYAMDFGKSDHFESSGVISFLESKADLNKFFKPSLIFSRSCSSFDSTINEAFLSYV